MYLFMIHFYSTPDASDSEAISVEVEKEKAEMILTFLQPSSALPNADTVKTIAIADKVTLTISLI